MKELIFKLLSGNKPFVLISPFGDTITYPLESLGNNVYTLYQEWGTNSGTSTGTISEGILEVWFDYAIDYFDEENCICDFRGANCWAGCRCSFSEKKI